MQPFYVPTSGPDSWRALLADPAKHWRVGFSARALATSWEAAGDFPPEVRAALEAVPAFANAEIVLGIPEHRVALPGGSRPSQSDLFVLFRTAAASAAMAVEGKVSESFDRTVDEWLADGSAGKAERLKYLASTLGVRTIPGSIRYQLLHRTASAIIEACRFLSPHAIMLVHSFSQTAEWYDDYAAFCSMLGAVPQVGAIVPVPGTTGPMLHLGWVTGDARFLTT